MSTTIQETKFGPMLGKKTVDISTLTADWVSDVEGRPCFTVVVLGPEAGGRLDYVDALGNEHAETFTEVLKVVTGGAPGSDHPVPMYVQTIKRSSTITSVMVGY